MSTGIEAIAAERQRQIEKEGWSDEHDDKHTQGEMAIAAACYADRAHCDGEWGKSLPIDWPWDAVWWKPGSTRRMLVKAGALIAAEIDRIDRARDALPVEDGHDETT